MSKDVVRVLLVEDSPSDARLLCEALQDYRLQRFEIERAEWLGEALALLAHESFDVILLDLNLPDSSGTETCRRMSRAAGQVPIIVLTGAEDEVVAAEAMCLGVQDYLVKGQTSGSVIGRTIRYTVERSQAQEALRQANERLQVQAQELQSQAEKVQTQTEELARVNTTLRASEERLHLAMEAGKVGVWEWQVGTERVEWSQGIYALLGYQPDEATPTDAALRRRIHSQDLARYDQALNDALERCDDYLCEFRVVWADGSVHWIEGRGQYAYVDDENGILLQMRGVLSDIDARKQAEEALRATRERLALAASGTRIGMYDHDLATGEVLCTDQFARLLGLRTTTTTTTTTTTLSQMYHYHDWVERVYPEDLTPVETTVCRRMTERAPYDVEYRVVWPDGSVHWVADRGVLQIDPDGRATRILGILMDITERKEAQETLRESMEKYRTLFESIDEGFCIIEVLFDESGKPVDYRFLETNPAFERQTGLHDAQGKRVRELIPNHEAYWFEIYGRIAVTGEPARFENEAKALQRWYDVYAFRVGQPQSRRVAILFNDIISRKRADEALRELTATLERKVDERTAELAHRARQLQKLTLELSETEDRERRRMAEILHDDLQQQLAAAKFHLSLMRNQVRHDASLQALTERIDNMLKDAIAKSRSLSHELSPAVLYHSDFAETLRWLANEMQAKHGLAVHVHTHGPVQLQSDAIKAFLYKTAQELLFNAVKHAGVQDVKIRVWRCGRCFCVSVSDRGRGFDPQQLREAAGFGLLNIRERIELLGGRMKIRSAPGQGSTFSLVVPDAAETPDTVGVGSRAYPMPGDHEEKEGDHGGPRLRILLADDHEIVRQGLVSLLDEEDAVEVIGEATNGREAVDLADRLHPDVVIMDMSMPVMSGDEATRQIKSQSPETRVVALSMFEDVEVRERMYQAGAESYVLKTAPSEELLAAIRGGARR